MLLLGEMHEADMVLIDPNILLWQAVYEGLQAADQVRLEGREGPAK